MNKYERIKNFLVNHKSEIDVYVPIVIGIASLITSIVAIDRANEGLLIAERTAKIERRSAIAESTPRLQFFLIRETQALLIQNAGLGPGTIYRMHLHNDASSGVENGVEPANQDVIETILSSLRQAGITRSDLSIREYASIPRMLSPQERFTYFSLAPKLTEEELDAFMNLHKWLYIDVCYTNISVDAKYLVSFQSYGQSPRTVECPDPLQEPVVFLDENLEQ